MRQFQTFSPFLQLPLELRRQVWSRTAKFLPRYQRIFEICNSISKIYRPLTPETACILRWMILPSSSCTAPPSHLLLTNKGANEECRMTHTHHKIFNPSYL